MCWVALKERFCNSHQVYHTYLMKAPRFIKDYNIEDEQDKETFLMVFGHDGPEDDHPTPEYDFPENDLIEEGVSEADLPKQAWPYLCKYRCTEKPSRRAAIATMDHHQQTPNKVEDTRDA